MHVRYFLFISALFLSLSGSAQFGASVFHNWNDASWKGESPQILFGIEHANSQELALNYWFRLPNKRIEFQPTVYANGFLNNSERLEYGFQFKTNVYLFDFGADCDCPTFGKQGPQLQKGFFVQLTPGVAQHHTEYPDFLYDVKRTVFTLGGGVGIDFGISNLLTITPLVSFRYTMKNYQADVYVTDIVGVPQRDLDARLLTYQLGLQATFRLDKRRY